MRNTMKRISTIILRTLLLGPKLAPPRLPPVSVGDTAAAAVLFLQYRRY